MTDQTPEVSFFDSTYEEALGLACELRDLVAAQGGRDRAVPEAYWARLHGSCESLRMTARLTQVIAWLLVQKAVHAGELSHEEARSRDRRLGGQEVCEPGRELPSAELPTVLAELRARTAELYVRVARLDALLYG